MNQNILHLATKIKDLNINAHIKKEYFQIYLLNKKNDKKKKTQVNVVNLQRQQRKTLLTLAFDKQGEINP